MQAVLSTLRNRLLSRRALVYASSSLLVGTGATVYYLNSSSSFPPSTKETRRPPPPWTPPSRFDNLQCLKASSQQDPFDLLIVGGGATGAGAALDAASRGLRVALVERDDFAAGTSSKSTKLVHGGVRYLQKAIMELDREQWSLVKEALKERKVFLHTAPYLSHMLPIMLPVYNVIQLPYYYAGCKMYDILAGSENMSGSYMMSRSKALETFPMLKQEGLVGAVVYHDGQHNDSRMNTALILSAVKHGAVVTNYTEVQSFYKLNERLNGARIRDELTGEEFVVHARGIINATGPFSDALLHLSSQASTDPACPKPTSSISTPTSKHKNIVAPSSGIHITLPNYYAPKTMGLLDPATSDGRVIFFLPWQGGVIAGTTDSPAPLEKDPIAPEEEIRWVLEEVRHYLSPDIKVRRGDVLSAWSGLRPLVRDPKSIEASGTAGLVRSHMIYVDPQGMLTIAGGKWTTYRAMAEEGVNRAVKEFKLRHDLAGNDRGSHIEESITENVRLVGSDHWGRNMFIGLIQRYGLDTEVAKHLSESYGDRAWTVCDLAEQYDETDDGGWPLHGKRLCDLYPYIEAEVRYAVKHEYAVKATDVLARRTRLTFLNAQAALDALPRVVDIMAFHLGWDLYRKKQEIQSTVKFLESMGLKREVIEAQYKEVGGLPEPIPRGWRETFAIKSQRNLRRISSSFYAGLGFFTVGKYDTSSPTTVDGWPTVPPVYSRAKFEKSELIALRTAFEAFAGEAAPTVTPFHVESTSTLSPTTLSLSSKSLPITQIIQVLREVPGYQDMLASDLNKDLNYVIEDAGFKGRKEVGFEEFVEICGDLKEITFAPALVTHDSGRKHRKAIPVEKSGGGV
ncbi:FAD dependent oxidoreductase-domain-containing protein [Lentinula aciculospora]|uniref:Glycerol-3-phosphate dehydrogenase n=1 Tax=Lentinula aciculospora TaxID=153920 RepID=A0A9W9AA21_9AGAR|nr:FAD dependent oxidoreductase-domain-containing protein [Lentinula aciculospora]